MRAAEFGLGAAGRALRQFAPGAWLLPGFATAAAGQLVDAVAAIAARSPFRHMQVPTGGVMSAAITNCGRLGWVADRSGYRYSDVDPATGRAWPAMPPEFAALAGAAAAAVGCRDYVPDACLVNRYAPGARMGLHRDADERDFTQPIVSVSLGLPIVFQFGGRSRRDSLLRLPLEHGDVVVFGGPSRRCYHGVLTLRDGRHELLGSLRINLTFRVAG